MHPQVLSCSRPAAATNACSFLPFGSGEPRRMSKDKGWSMDEVDGTTQMPTEVQPQTGVKSRWFCVPHPQICLLLSHPVTSPDLPDSPTPRTMSRPPTVRVALPILCMPGGQSSKGNLAVHHFRVPKVQFLVAVHTIEPKF